MTSASELFHSSRRYRSGLRHNPLATITGFDYSSSLPDATSSPSSSSSSSSSSLYQQHRSTIRRHTTTTTTTTSSSQNNRRLDGCSRRIHRHRPHHLEHEAVNPEEGDTSETTNSRSIDDRLPGSVLLARERLVQRLRGVSVSRNRQSSGDQHDFSSNNVLEARNNTRAEMVSESWRETRRNHPVGLNEDELKCLQLEVFSSGSSRKTIESLMECTICLEGFQDGDKIVCLVCTHRFHSSCLFPWVRVCGACPNCRKPVLVNAPVK